VRTRGGGEGSAKRPASGPFHSWSSPRVDPRAAELLAAAANAPSLSAAAIPSAARMGASVMKYDGGGRGTTARCV
jgi:hypothetical protein